MPGPIEILLVILTAIVQSHTQNTCNPLSEVSFAEKSVAGFKKPSGGAAAIRTSNVRFPGRRSPTAGFQPNTGKNQAADEHRLDHINHHAPPQERHY